MGHLGHSHETLGTLQITYGTLGTLAWDTWDTPNYVWDTWDTHVGHYLNKYVTLYGTLSITESLYKCPVSHHCSVVAEVKKTYWSVPGSGTVIVS